MEARKPFFSGLRNACASFGQGDLEAREVWDNLMTTCHASPESNDDGIENSKRAIGLDWQTNNFAGASRFFIHFFAVAARLPRESAYNSTFCRGSERRQRLYFSFLELWYSLLEFNSRKFANIWRIERVGISTIKYEVPKIHILSDVFVDVAVVLA